MSFAVLCRHSRLNPNADAKKTWCTITTTTIAAAAAAVTTAATSDTAAAPTAVAEVVV